MTRYYISDPASEHGFVELSEDEWLAVMGDDTTHPYASGVYHGEMSIDEVPEDIREEVQSVVDNKVSRWGLYSERSIPDSEALSILTGGDDA